MLIPILLVLTGLILIVLLAIIGYAALVGHKLTVMERVSVGGHPSILGLRWEDVTFPSRGDEVTLSGWYRVTTTHFMRLLSMPRFPVYLSTTKTGLHEALAPRLPPHPS